MPFRINKEISSTSILLSSFSSESNVCFLLNCSTSQWFLSVLVNGNSTRGLKVKILIDTAGASGFIKIKILNGYIYLTRTKMGSLRIVGENFTTNKLLFSAADLDLSEAETVEYIE